MLRKLSDEFQDLSRACYPCLGGFIEAGRPRCVKVDFAKGRTQSAGTFTHPVNRSQARVSASACSMPAAIPARLFLHRRRRFDRPIPFRRAATNLEAVTGPMDRVSDEAFGIAGCDTRLPDRDRMGFQVVAIVWHIRILDIWKCPLSKGTAKRECPRCRRRSSRKPGQPAPITHSGGDARTG